MKAFKLTMMAAMLAFASTAMAQDVVTLTAASDLLDFKAGETKELVINLNYETTAELCGANFSLMLPDGIILDGFADKDAMLAAKKKALAKACSIDEEDNPWGEDGDDSFFYDIKGKTDGGLLFILMDSDKTPFVSTKCKLVTITLKALEDVVGVGKIYAIAYTDTDNVSVGLGELADSEFGINKDVVTGINEVMSAETTAPAYNLQGIRVNNAKGLIIRDGKKMVVK
jgi:hypothetical protein